MRARFAIAPILVAAITATARTQGPYQLDRTLRGLLKSQGIGLLDPGQYQTNRFFFR